MSQCLHPSYATRLIEKEKSRGDICRVCTVLDAGCTRTVLECTYNAAVYNFPAPLTVTYIPTVYLRRKTVSITCTDTMPRPRLLQRGVSTTPTKSRGLFRSCFQARYRKFKIPSNGCTKSRIATCHTKTD